MTEIIKERFVSKIELNPNGCAEWTAALNNKGYGVLGVGRKLNKNGRYTGVLKLAHRLSYEEYIGEIPRNLVIDHICKNTKCVNPSHLRAVTQSENIFFASKPNCPQGHEFTEENTAMYRGHRCCKQCNRDRAKRSHL